MRCKKSIAQSTCKHCKRDQQIKYRPPPRGSPGCAAIGPLFLSHSGAKGKRAAESLVCESLSDFQGSLSAKSVHAALTIGEGVWPWAHLAVCCCGFSARLRPRPRLSSTGCPEKLGLGPVSYSHLVRRQRGTGAVLPLVFTHCKRGFLPLCFCLSAPRRCRMISSGPPLAAEA